jgi:glutamate-1-semialdehyde 2,1-aminomutase
MSVLAIVQARMGSSRYPGKVMLPISNSSIIEVLLKRLQKSTYINEIVVAIPDIEIDTTLFNHIKSINFSCIRGSEDNVLKRFYKAASSYNHDFIVRITGDCPLIDSHVVDSTIKYFLDNDFDYVSNINPPTFPDGLDVEIFTKKALSKTYETATSLFDREHVTPFMRSSNLFKVGNYASSIDYSHMRWTLDEISDYKVIKGIFKEFDPDIYFSWEQIIELERLKKELFVYNEAISRNEGSLNE